MTLTVAQALRELPVLSKAVVVAGSSGLDRTIRWTNNGTEQVIGRMKMRARTVRGYKT